MLEERGFLLESTANDLNFKVLDSSCLSDFNCYFELDFDTFQLLECFISQREDLLRILLTLGDFLTDSSLKLDKCYFIICNDFSCVFCNSVFHEGSCLRWFDLNEYLLSDSSNSLSFKKFLALLLAYLRHFYFYDFGFTALDFLLSIFCFKQITFWTTEEVEGQF